MTPLGYFTAVLFVLDKLSNIPGHAQTRRAARMSRGGGEANISPLTVADNIPRPT